MSRCPDCNRRRALSATRCPHCGSERENTDVGAAAALAGGAVVMASSFAIMDWPDRLLFLAIVLTIGGTAAHFTERDVWAAWVAWGFIGGVLGIVIWALRLTLRVVFSERWSWTLILSVLSFSLFYVGPGYLSWLEHAMHRG